MNTYIELLCIYFQILPPLHVQLCTLHCKCCFRCYCCTKSNLITIPQALCYFCFIKFLEFGGTIYSDCILENYLFKTSGLVASACALVRCCVPLCKFRVHDVSKSHTTNLFPVHQFPNGFGFPSFKSRITA